MTNEKEYRQLVKKSFDRIQNAFDDVDPDLVEIEESQGALTITFAGGKKLILSQQPSVRQIWVAAASLGRAYHLDYAPSEDQWIDDKGEGVELLGFIRKVVKDNAGIDLEI